LTVETAEIQPSTASLRPIDPGSVREEAAVGRLVRTELYCGSIDMVTVRPSDGPGQHLADLAGNDGRVAGAECRWSREGRPADLLLVVPPELAEEFAQAPEVELNFMSRRQIPASVEWLGRTDALSLRNSAILREIH
jgi:hypothetical protein